MKKRQIWNNVLQIVLLWVALVIVALAQSGDKEKGKSGSGSKNVSKIDSVLELSIPALEGKIQELQELVNQNQKTYDTATQAAENSKQNIIILQSQISAIRGVLGDKSLREKIQTKAE